MILWVGIEKEGKLKGMKTLFVGSPKITFNELERTLREHPDINHVYFGAGKCSKINARVLSMFLKHHSIYTTTAEVPFSKLYCLTPYILKHINLIITINKQDFLLLRNTPTDSIQVKLQSLKGNKKVVIITKGIQNVDTTELMGKIYKGDKVLL
jgi:hypothetical protein